MVNAVDTADFAEQHPVREWRIVLPDVWTGTSLGGTSGIVVVMASYLSCGLLAPWLTSSHTVHAVRFRPKKLPLSCIAAGARYWD